MALDLAATRPDAVRSLVLLGAVVSGFDPDAPPPPMWDAVVAADRSDDLDALADAEARMWLADPDGTRLPDGVLDLVRRHEPDRAWSTSARRPPRTSRPSRPRSTACGRRRPGARRGRRPRPRGDRPDRRPARRRGFPGRERVRLHGVAHLPALERPEEVAALVGDFLTGVEQTG